VSSLLIISGDGHESRAEFEKLFNALRQNLAPVGTLEEILVEKIAICCWRQKRALRWEAEILSRGFLRRSDSAFWNPPETLSGIELEKVTGHRTLPATEELDRVLRYDTSIHRQLAYAISQLERLQRARKGEHVPAPVSVQLSGDQ
jgi:hypothetical protein